VAELVRLVGGSRSGRNPGQGATPRHSSTVAGGNRKSGPGRPSSSGHDSKGSHSARRESPAAERKKFVSAEEAIPLNEDDAAVLSEF